jgi:hypothetical protein
LSDVRSDLSLVNIAQAAAQRIGLAHARWLMTAA